MTDILEELRRLERYPVVGMGSRDMDGKWLAMDAPMPLYESDHALLDAARTIAALQAENSKLLAQRDGLAAVARAFLAGGDRDGFWATNWETAYRGARAALAALEEPTNG